MGTEIGQRREWDYAGETEWFLLDDSRHEMLQYYVAELNHFYLRTPALWEIDDSWEGYRWIDPDNANESIISCRRMDRDGREILAVVNFTPVVREDFLLGVPEAGIYEEIFNSDLECFGGSGVTNTQELRSSAIPWNTFDHSIRLRLPPLGILILEYKKKDGDFQAGTHKSLDLP